MNTADAKPRFSSPSKALTMRSRFDSVSLPLLLGLLVALVAGCGGAQTDAPPSAADLLDALRARAASSPSDPAAWRELAEAEMLVPGGDATRARETIDHARALAERSPSLALLSGWQYEQAGLDAEALGAFLEALALARVEPDPLAPLIAETAMDQIAMLRGAVPDYEERVNGALEVILDDPGAFGLIAVDTAANYLIDASLRRGDRAAAAAVAGHLPCLKEWRTVGPFGPYMNLSFDERLDAEASGPLAESYELGAGVGEEATHEAKTRRCVVQLGGGRRMGAGSTIAETFVEISPEAAGPHLLSLEAPGSLKVYVDGALVHELDRRARTAPSHQYIPLELSAGRHEIELKITSSNRSPSIIVLLERVGSRGPDYQPARGVALPEPTSAFASTLLGLVLDGRSDIVAAGEMLRPLVGPESTAFVAFAYANVLSRHPFVTGQHAEEKIRRLIELAATRDPDAVDPALALALMEQGERDSYERLRAVAEKWPDVIRVQMEWASMLQQREQEAEAEAIYRQVMQAVPSECDAVRRISALMRSRQRIAEANALIERLMICNQSAFDRLTMFIRQHAWEEASAELERLRPLRTEEQVRRIELSLARATGDAETVARIRAEIEEENPQASANTRRQVDQLLAAGQRRQAVTLLETTVSADPAQMVSLRSLRRDLTGRDDLQPYRKDGLEVIRDFEASGREYADQGQLLMFDYMVTRIYPDGSARHLVHQIYRVQSEQSIEQLGQIQVPGQLLTLRSIKPDGRILEPERIAGLDSIPMSELAIGDYVEYEYVRATGPRLNGGFLSDGWIFQNFEEPFDFSEMVVVVPRDLPLVVEALGPVPAPVETADGDLRVLRFTVRESMPLVAEPNSVSTPPILPSLRVGVNSGWEPFFEAERSRQLGLDPIDPAAERLVREILGDAMSAAPIDKARILRGWIAENVEPGSGWGGLAPTMLESRAGSWVRILHYMLQLAGVPSQYVFSRELGKPAPTELSRPGMYEEVFLRIDGGESGPRFIWPGVEGIPFDYIPAQTRGQVGVVLAEGFEQVTVPTADPDADLVAVELDIYPGSGGSARVEVRETLRGFSAWSWRNQLDQVPEADLDRVLADAYVARVIPGATMTSLEITGREDSEGPLVIAYTAESDALGRQVRGGRLLPPFFANAIASRYAQLPTRTTTEMVGGMNNRYIVRIHGVPPQTPVPEAQRLEGPGGATYDFSAAMAEGTLSVTRSIRIPDMLAPVEVYPELVRFSRRVTELELSEIGIPE